MEIKFRAPHAIDATLSPDNLTHWLISTQVEMYPGAKPRHASPGWYWVANLLLLTWPYRVWLDSICQRQRYDYVKEIVTAPPTAPPAPVVVHHHHHHTTTVVHAPSARAALSMQQQLY